MKKKKNTLKYVTDFFLIFKYCTDLYDKSLGNRTHGL